MYLTSAASISRTEHENCIDVALESIDLVSGGGEGAGVAPESA